MKRDGDARRKFIAIDEIGSLDILIAAEDDTGKTVETEINGYPAPGSLLDGTKSRFWQISKSHAGGRNRGDNASGGSCGRRQRKETLVVEAREIQAKSPEIVGEKNGAAHFGVDGFAEGVGERQTEGKRRKMVVVCDEAPATGQQGLDFQALLLATLRRACAVRVAEAAVINAKIAVRHRSIFDRPGAEGCTLEETSAAHELDAQGSVHPRSGSQVKSMPTSGMRMPEARTLRPAGVEAYGSQMSGTRKRRKLALMSATVLSRRIRALGA